MHQRFLVPFAQNLEAVQPTLQGLQAQTQGIHIQLLQLDAAGHLVAIAFDPLPKLVLGLGHEGHADWSSAFVTSQKALDTPLTALSCQGWRE